MVEKTIPFRAGDGFQCNLIHVWDEKNLPTKGPVLLVHGAGVRANMFRGPLDKNIVQLLIDDGFDVWLENWRASKDLRPNHWTLDQAALYDHPEAVKTVIRETGCKELKAIIHCQGSTSFTMSAIAGLIPEVKVIVSNAVSLHPILPRWNAFMATVFVPLLSCITPYLNPQWVNDKSKRKWPVDTPGIRGKIISRFVFILMGISFFLGPILCGKPRDYCGNKVCKFAKFIYGTAPWCLWACGEKPSISGETHNWLKDEFGWVPLSFFNQMNRCFKKGYLVPVQGYKGLPEDFVSNEPKTEARFIFITGTENRIFLPESQIESYNYFKKFKDNHEKYTSSGLKHLDVFMGNNAQGVFPKILYELNN